MDAGVEVMLSMAEVVALVAEVVTILTAPLLVPAAIYDYLSAIAKSVKENAMMNWREAIRRRFLTCAGRAIDLPE